jgi:hypothetical protein
MQARYTALLMSLCIIEQMIREINSADWPAFCLRLTQQRAGATVKLETIEPDGVKSELAANAAFQSITFDKTDGCSDVMTLRLRTAREIVHEITEPIQIRLQPSGTPGDFNPLQIEAESGMVFITFPPGHPRANA